MKNLFKRFNLFIASLAMVFMYSCQKDDNVSTDSETSGIEFLFTGDRVSNKDGAPKASTTDAKDDESCDMALASYAVIEMSGQTYTIDLKTWGSNFKTDLIELNPGTYQVTSAQLYDSDDNALYATPTSDSQFGNFVNQALPFEVTVENYTKMEYEMEVLCVEAFTPPQFGFVFWDVNIKQTKNLCIFANFCEPETGHKVATLRANVYPNENETSASDLIWSAEANGDYDNEDSENELLCLKLPYDPNMPTEDQSFYIELYINDVSFHGTMPLDRVDMINEESAYQYLHLNEDCKGDFDVFKNTFNVAWEDIEEDEGENDADYNDFIVEVTTFTDIETGNLNFTFLPLARGGGFAHSFKFWLPGTGYVVSSSDNGILSEEISGNTRILVYENTVEAFDVNEFFVNTVCPPSTSAFTGTGIPKTVTVENVSGDFNYYLMTPFDANLLVRTGNKVFDLSIGNLFPKSTFDKDGDIMENGLITPAGWKWAEEGTDIRDIYGEDFRTNYVPIDPSGLWETCNGQQ